METLIKKKGTLLVSSNKKNEIEKETKVPSSFNSHEINLKIYDYAIF